MSIATQLTALAANRDAIKAAIEAKGVADAGDTLAEFPAAIASIPSGGGDEWTPPSDWPNLRDLMAADTEEYEYKMYMLFDTAIYPLVPFIMNIVGGAAKAVTSDGSTYMANATHTWDASDTYGRYRWIAWYSNTEFTKIAAGRTYSTSSYAILWIVGNKAFVGNDSNRPNFKTEYMWYLRCIEVPSIKLVDTSTNNGANRMFFSNTNLRKIPDGIDLSGIVNCASMFDQCKNLTSVPSLDTSSATTTAAMFNQCSSLKKLPSVLNLSNSTDVHNMFFGCTSITEVTSSLDLSKATDVSLLFYECASLVAVPPILDISSATKAAEMFRGCISLLAVPDILDTSLATAVYRMFHSCYSLTAVPDTLNLSSVTSASNQTGMFDGCYALTKMPTHVTSNWSLSFGNSRRIRDKDSVASFTNGTVTGGFVGNLNTCPNSGQTINLNSDIKGLFTAEEQAAIETAMSNKNWTLSW